MGDEASEAEAGGCADCWCGAWFAGAGLSDRVLSLFGPTVAKLKGKADVSGLIYALYNPTAGVRQAAAEALGHFDDPRAVESLIVALDDPDPDVR